MQVAWSAVRRFFFWAIPLALVGTLVWTFLPHGTTPTSTLPPQARALLRPSSSDVGSGEATQAQRSTPRSGSATPYAQIHQGDLEGTDEAGGERWRIVADDVTVVEDKQTVRLRNVRATFYEKDGTTIRVTGTRGRYDTRTREVEIEGNVHGTSSNGRELFADQVHWVPGSGTLTGNGHIRLLQERVIMYADQMISNTTLGQTQFFGHVHAAVR